jgi:hypothetical protein
VSADQQGSERMVIIWDSEAAACALVSETSEGFGQALASSETEFRTQKI